MQLSRCSSWVSWWGRALDRVFSNRWSYKLPFLPMQGGITVSRAGKAYRLGSWVKQNYMPYFLARQDHWLGSESGQNIWLGFYLGVTVRENSVCQDRNIGWWKPQTPSPSQSDVEWSNHAEFSHCLFRARLEWEVTNSQEVTHNARGARCPLWTPFPTEEPEALWALFVQSCDNLGEEECCQSATIPFTLTM